MLPHHKLSVTIKFCRFGAIGKRNLMTAFDFPLPYAYLPSASWLDDRCRKARKGAGEESPGSMETRCRVTPGGGDPRDSATETNRGCGLERA